MNNAVYLVYHVWTTPDVWVFITIGIGFMCILFTQWDLFA